MSTMPPTLRERIAKTVQERTGRRVDNLNVEVSGERVILRGRAGSFHVKQLALSGVRAILPNALLRNEIAVA